MRDSPVCVCGHAADWHSHGGMGDCEHDADCGCKRFSWDSRIRLRQPDEDAARALAFNGGRYDQREVYRLLRLALHEIDCLREERT